MRVATNIPAEPLRWSVIRAAEEFDIDQITLRKRLVKNEEQAGEDGCYSTHQILTSIFDSSKALKDKEIKARTEHVELKNAILKGESLVRNEVDKVLEASHQAIVQIIKGSNLTKRDQKDIMSNIEDCLARLENVARQQGSQLKRDDSE